MSELDGIPLFKGEVMLSSWSETSKSGKSVTFAIDVDAAPDGHPFKGLGTGKYGQKFMLVAVPVTDSGKPVPEAPIVGSAKSASPPNDEGSFRVTDGPPNAPQRVETSGTASGSKERRRFSELPLPQQVALRCQDEGFRRWIADKECADPEHIDAEAAAVFVRLRCEVSSRSMISSGTLAGERWKGLEMRFLVDTGQMAEVRNG